MLSSEDHAAPVRVAIAAESPAFREILREQLQRETRVEVVGEVAGGHAARLLARRLKPDILLIEEALTREFAHHSSPASSAETDPSGWTTAIVVLVATACLPAILDAFALGARGVVLGTSLPHLWRTGMQSILAGNRWMGEESAALLLDAARESAARPGENPLPPFGLTRRELEIAGKIAAGLPNRDVAREFSIRERTVKHHLTNIFKKLGVASRLELALLIRDGIAGRQPSGRSSITA
jgi:DNA-binding NarL/FixJ family response regulator